MTSSETHFSKAFAATDLCRDIETLFPELVTIRHTLHQHPEKGTQEFETDRIITGCLDAWGIPYRMIADTGILASLTGEGSDPVGSTVGLRADIDALPIEEDPSHACCSLNSGMMHACGHDAHTTIALGTARLLQLHRSEWSGTVKFFFQPAEETVGGAQRMVEQGCMKDPDVDYVTGLHVMPQFHTGELEMKYGKLNAASDEVLIDLHGRSCHGAYPEGGVDTVVMAATLISSLQTFVSRTISPLNSAVLSFGEIQGGTACNIVCDHVRIHGTLRTLDAATRSQAKEYIRNQAISIAAAYGGTADVLFHSGYDALINDNALVDAAAECADEILGKEHINWKEFPSLGVEDFSFFQEAAKKGGVFYHLGCTAPETPVGAPVHTAGFLLDDDCLKIGVAMQYTLTRKLLKK